MEPFWSHSLSLYIWRRSGLGTGFRMLLRPRSVRKLELTEMIGNELNSAMIGFADAIGFGSFPVLGKSPHVLLDRSGTGCRTAANSPIEKPRSIFLRFSIISARVLYAGKSCRLHQATHEKEVGFVLGLITAASTPKPGWERYLLGIG